MGDEHRQNMTALYVRKYTMLTLLWVAHWANQLHVRCMKTVAKMYKEVLDDQRRL